MSKSDHIAVIIVCVFSDFRPGIKFYYLQIAYRGPLQNRAARYVITPGKIPLVQHWSMDDAVINQLTKSQIKYTFLVGNQMNIKIKQFGKFMNSLPYNIDRFW